MILSLGYDSGDARGRITLLTVDMCVYNRVSLPLTWPLMKRRERRGHTEREPLERSTATPTLSVVTPDRAIRLVYSANVLVLSTVGLI